MLAARSRDAQASSGDGEYLCYAELDAPIVPFDSPPWHLAARAAGLPLADDVTMGAAPDAQRDRFAGELLRLGVRAASYDSHWFTELMVYDPCVPRPVAALPTLELLRRRAKFGAAFPVERPRWRRDGWI